MTNFSQFESIASLRNHYIKNESGEEIPAFAVCEVTGVSEGDDKQPVYSVVKPTGTLYRPILFNGPNPIAAGVTMFASAHIVMKALVDPEIAEADIQKKALGPKAGQWELYSGADGGQMPRYWPLGVSLYGLPVADLTLVGITEKPAITVNLPLQSPVGTSPSSLSVTEVTNRGGVFEVNAGAIDNVSGAQVNALIAFSGEATGNFEMETGGMRMLLECLNDSVSHYIQYVQFLDVSPIAINGDTVVEGQNFAGYVGLITIEPGTSVEFEVSIDNTPGGSQYIFKRGTASLWLQ